MTAKFLDDSGRANKFSVWRKMRYDDKKCLERMKKEHEEKKTISKKSVKKALIV